MTRKTKDSPVEQRHKWAASVRGLSTEPNARNNVNKVRTLRTKAQQRSIVALAAGETCGLKWGHLR